MKKIIITIAVVFAAPLAHSQERTTIITEHSGKWVRWVGLVNDTHLVGLPIYEIHGHMDIADSVVFNADTFRIVIRTPIPMDKIEINGKSFTN